MGILKNILVVAILMCFDTFKACEAYSAVDYANILKGGIYFIECTISSDYMCGNSKVKSSDKYLIAKASSGDFLFEKNTYCPTAWYQYRYYKVVKYGEEKYRSLNSSKNKIIDVKKVKLNKVKPGSKSDTEFYNTLNDWADVDIDMVLHMLGGISKTAGVLPNYRVDLIGSKKEELNGRLYNVEEYSIKAPHNARLKLYYLNGELVKCIKLLNGTLLSNRYFSDIKSVARGYIVADIHRFDKKVDATIFALQNKK